MQKWLHRILESTKNTPVPLLQKCGMFGVLSLFLISAVTVNLGTNFGAQFELMLSAVLPGIVVDLTNEEREEHDLNALKRSPILDEAARLKAEHMRDNDYFAHFSPEGISPWYWFDEVGYDYVHAGENLAVFFDESDDVVEAWMDSPLHRDNILKSEYEEIGLAAVEAEHEGYKTVFVVQLFGTLAQQSEPEQAPVVATLEQEATEEIVTTVPTELPMAPEVSSEPENVTPEDKTPTPTEESIDPSEETTVERISVEDKTVFVANHEATTTVPLTLGSTEEIRAGDNREGHYSRPQAPRNALTVFYALIALLSISILFASITHATKHAHFAHAVYGTALLFVATGAILFHTYIVQAVVL